MLFCSVLALVRQSNASRGKAADHKTVPCCSKAQTHKNAQIPHADTYTPGSGSADWKVKVTPTVQSYNMPSSKSLTPQAARKRELFSHQLALSSLLFFFFLNTIWNFLDLSHTLSTGSPSPTLLLDHGVWIDLSEAIGKPRRWGLRTQSIYCPSASVSTSGLSIPQWPQAPQHTHSHTHSLIHSGLWRESLSEVP